MNEKDLIIYIVGDTMNKQQLANQIFKKCDDLRGSVDASVYKDYILGFIFYKWLSVKEEDYLINEMFYDDEKLKELTDDNYEIKDDIKRRVGFYIPYVYLFRNLYTNLNSVDVGTISNALVNFNKNIYKEYDDNYKEIFTSLQDGLKNLGGSIKDQNKQVRKLIKMAQSIPMQNNDYDVLGYIYEYLIANFAASAGKKAGEFYTPNEPAEIISRIVARHLKGRNKISVYDSCSGSSALLLNIGKNYVKEGGNHRNVSYFAQEKNKSTYNLTRMNLIMKDIQPANIKTRNADTLEEDWPLIENNDGSRDPMIVDAVVSNPPYSAKWKQNDSDSRFEYGCAPKTKADYAFLQHDLYHLDDDGIMAIVLPHGVLFRGKQDDESEGSIRKNLVDHRHIETIIGLPANLFYGTGIPTIIMILKKKRENDDILFIDASKQFIKDGKKNKLRDSDIKKIVDAVFARKDIPGFARLVSKEEIKKQDYNLNIPRYIDSSDKPENWDVFSIMNGVIPNSEIDELQDVWNAFPSLREQIFNKQNEHHSTINNNYSEMIEHNIDVLKYRKAFNPKIQETEDIFKEELLTNIETINVNKKDKFLTDFIFDNFADVPLLNPYDIYQKYSDAWKIISIDIDTIQKEIAKDSNKKVLDVLREIEPVFKDEKEDEESDEIDYENQGKQIGNEGKILPYDIVQKILLNTECGQLETKENRINEIDSQIEDYFERLDQDDIEELANDENTAFNTDEVIKRDLEMLEDIEEGEIGTLNKYIKLLAEGAKKKDKQDFICEHQSDVRWENIEQNKDKTYSKTNVSKYLKELYASFKFNDESIENIIHSVTMLIGEKKELNKSIKALKDEIEEKTKLAIETIDEEDAYKVLSIKWIQVLIDKVNNIPDEVVKYIKSKVQNLDNKYSCSMLSIEKNISDINKELLSMLDQLECNEFDKKGIQDFKKLLGEDVLS